MKPLAHTMNTLTNLRWRWAMRYYGKKLKIYWHLYISIVRGRTYWEARVDGVSVKLFWSFPYHHEYARALSLGGHEPTLLAMWKKHAETASVIMDGGSYNGMYGLIAAATNPRAKVIIFEPDTINIRHIERNIAMNKLTNVTLVPKALTGKKGTAYFKKHDGGSAGTLSAAGEIEIETTALTDYETPDLIKLDIVGAEYDTLVAAKEILSNSRDLKILLELYPQNREKLLTMLQELGFETVYLYPRSDGGVLYYFIYKHRPLLGL